MEVENGKKICFVGYSFSGSILSMISALLKDGYYIDYYICRSGKEKEIEAIDYVVPQRYIQKLEKSDNIRGINSFSNKERLSIYHVTTVGKSGGYLKNALGWLCVCRLFFRLKKCRYNLVNIVGQGAQAALLAKLLKPISVQIIHEVNDNNHDKNCPSKILALSVKNEVPIIVHSIYSYNRAVYLYPSYKDKIVCIPFGLFYSYLDFDRVKIEDLGITESNYILFVGYIVPYKGVDIFIESALLMLEENEKLHFVIAGSGGAKNLEGIRKNRHFTIINRWISNDEFACLIKNARIIVCPYRTASQSGLPQSAFVFHTPIYATNTGAFSEIVTKETGGLFDEIAPEDVKDKILSELHVIRDKHGFDKIASDLDKRIISKYKVIISENIIRL